MATPTQMYDRTSESAAAFIFGRRRGSVIANIIMRTYLYITHVIPVARHFYLIFFYRVTIISTTIANLSAIVNHSVNTI